jgi:hypothetical protein
MDRILVNGMRTPDGTEIYSRYRHDYVTHEDANGETYMVDGGTDYIRRSKNKANSVDLTVYSDGRHIFDRNWFHWGNRGPDGTEELTWVQLVRMSTKHIEAILETQTHINEYVSNLMKAELKYRADLG